MYIYIYITFNLTSINSFITPLIPFLPSKCALFISTLDQKVKLRHMLDIIHIGPVPIVVIPIPIELLNLQPLIDIIHVQEILEFILLRDSTTGILACHLFHDEVTDELTTFVLVVREVDVHH